MNATSVTPPDLAATKSESSRWQQVASVPPDVHAVYVHEAKAAGGEDVASRQ